MAARGNSKLALARRSLGAVKRKVQDERVMGAAGCAFGGAGGAFLDSRAESTTIGDTPIARNAAYGAGLVALALVVKKLPLQAALLGAGMGLLGAGSFATTQSMLADRASDEE